MDAANFGRWFQQGRYGHAIVLEEDVGTHRELLLPDHTAPDGWRRIRKGEAFSGAEVADLQPLYLPDGALEAIVNAGRPLVTPSLDDERSRRHLDLEVRLADTIGVRDKLLQLVVAQGYDRIRNVAAINTARGGTHT